MTVAGLSGWKLLAESSHVSGPSVMVADVCNWETATEAATRMTRQPYLRVALPASKEDVPIKAGIKIVLPNTILAKMPHLAGLF